MWGRFWNRVRDVAYDSFWVTMHNLGLSNVKGTILILGIDNAGKTTLLHYLAHNLIAVHARTERATSETFRFNHMDLKTIDLGGHREAREAWRYYYMDIAGIFFMLDGSESKADRWQETAAVLSEVMLCPDLMRVPVVVFANKMDSPEARSVLDIRNYYMLTHTTGMTRPENPNIRPVEFFAGSVVQEQNVWAALRWLTDMIHASPF